MCACKGASGEEKQREKAAILTSFMLGTESTRFFMRFTVADRRAPRSSTHQVRGVRRFQLNQRQKQTKANKANGRSPSSNPSPPISKPSASSISINELHNRPTPSRIFPRHLSIRFDFFVAVITAERARSEESWCAMLVVVVGRDKG